jgi:uncharacterized membrane protein
MKRGFIAVRMAIEALLGVLIAVNLIADILMSSRVFLRSVESWGGVLTFLFVVGLAVLFLWDALRMRRKLRALDALVETVEES